MTINNCVRAAHDHVTLVNQLTQSAACMPFLPCVSDADSFPELFPRQETENRHNHNMASGVDLAIYG